MSIWLMLTLFLLIANLPWIGERVFFCIGYAEKAHMGTLGRTDGLLHSDLVGIHCF
jgi:hypothetical protein